MSHLAGCSSVLNRSTGEFNDLLHGYVWVEQGHVIGNITVQRADKYATRWRIANVAVAPGFRNRGISRRLMEVAIDHYGARRRAVGRVLQVYRSNAVARSLYDSLGSSWSGTMDLCARAPRVERYTPNPLIKRFPATEWQSL